MGYFTIYNNMIMRKRIYIVMRTTDFGRMPVIAFNSVKEAEEYGTQKYDKNGDHNWYVSGVYLEDNK